MKRSVIASRKARKGKIVPVLERGKKPFRGAQGPRGPKDPKDLRGSKGLLIKEAEEIAEGEERYGVIGTRPAPSRSARTSARRSGRR